MAAGGAAVGITTAEPRAGLFTAVATDVIDGTDVKLSEEGEAVWEAGLRRRDWAGTPLADLQLDRLSLVSNVKLLKKLANGYN